MERAKQVAEIVQTASATEEQRSNALLLWQQLVREQHARAEVAALDACAQLHAAANADEHTELLEACEHATSSVYAALEALGYASTLLPRAMSSFAPVNESCSNVNEDVAANMQTALSSLGHCLACAISVTLESSTAAHDSETALKRWLHSTRRVASFLRHCGSACADALQRVLDCFAHALTQQRDLKQAFTSVEGLSCTSGSLDTCVYAAEHSDATAMRSAHSASTAAYVIPHDDERRVYRQWCVYFPPLLAKLDASSRAPNEWASVFADGINALSTAIKDAEPSINTALPCEAALQCTIAMLWPAVNTMSTIRIAWPQAGSLNLLCQSHNGLQITIEYAQWLNGLARARIRFDRQNELLTNNCTDPRVGFFGAECADCIAHAYTEANCLERTISSAFAHEAKHILQKAPRKAWRGTNALTASFDTEKHSNSQASECVQILINSVVQPFIALREHMYSRSMHKLEYICMAATISALLNAVWERGGPVTYAGGIQLEADVYALYNAMKQDGLHHASSEPRFSSSRTGEPNVAYALYVAKLLQGYETRELEQLYQANIHSLRDMHSWNALIRKPRGATLCSGPNR